MKPLCAQMNVTVSYLLYIKIVSVNGFGSYIKMEVTGLEILDAIRGLYMSYSTTGWQLLEYHAFQIQTCSGIARINTLRPRQNGRHFPDDIFKRIFLNDKVKILLRISIKFVHRVQIDNIPALIQIMGWHLAGDKPLSEPMMVSLLTHSRVTRPQWVNTDPLYST